MWDENLQMTYCGVSRVHGFRTTAISSGMTGIDIGLDLFINLLILITKIDYADNSYETKLPECLRAYWQRKDV